MKYPNMRKELLEYLLGLSDLSYQKECWVKGNCPVGVQHDEFDYAVHFLFDDTTLASEPNKLIGIFLKNDQEALAVKKVCEAIDIILKKYGSNLSDLEYISLPEWKDVIEKSRVALKIFN